MSRNRRKLWIAGAVAAGLATPLTLSAQQPNQPLNDLQTGQRELGQPADPLQQDPTFQDPTFQDQGDQLQQQRDQDRALSEGEQGRQSDPQSGEQPPAPGQQQRGEYERQRGEFDAQGRPAARGQDSSRGRGQAGLGVAVVPEPGSAGVRVARIYPDSPAEAAGIREGDRILEIDGQQIASVDDLLTTVRSSQPGSTVQVAVERDGVRQTLEAMLETRAEALSRPGGYPGSQFGGAPPWTDDLSAHISMLEQEVQRLSEEIADLKAMLASAPGARGQDDARGRERFDQPQAGPPRQPGQVEQDVRGQSTDQLRPDAPPPAHQPSQRPSGQPTSPPGQEAFPSDQPGNQDT